MIQLTNVMIGHQHALLSAQDLNLSSGHIYALIGRNGIGKSTFIQTISGHLNPLAGEIAIDGKSISGFSIQDFAETISLVDTRFEGVEYLKVKDYLALGRAPYTDAFGRLDSKDWQIIEEVASDLSIEHLLEKYTDQISDGERQLCSVGRAFVQETPVILLDEPTAFLDYINRKNLLELLIRLATGKNKCIVLSTHDLDLCLEQPIPFLLAAHGQIIMHSQLTKEEILIALS
ncbi:MAG: ABC transporter ATP-binding protein [Flavobacteriia bacterium]